MFVGVCKLVLIIPGCDSLKGKRHVMRSIKDRVAAKFNVAIAETGDQDLWQRAEIGVCAVGNDHSRVNAVLDSVTGFIEGMMVATLVDRQFEIITF
jgi:uncharacterized protein YlxP (DUF503 family)